MAGRHKQGPLSCHVANRDQSYLSLPLEGATDQRARGLELLKKKYEIDAKISNT